MINTQLILIDGMSGSGKSTTTQNLARQFRLNGIRYHWLHEEIREHPIRDGEFSLGPLVTKADYQRNMADMFRRWERQVQRIRRSKSVYLMEGVLTSNIIRYFYEGDYRLEKVLEYYQELYKRMAPVRPVIVHLHRTNVRETLESIYDQRGEWWKKLILSGGNLQRYLSNHGLSGDEGVYTMWEHYQALSEAAVGCYPGPKLTIDTSGRQWDSYIENITLFLGLRYFPPQVIPVDHPKEYCGQYTVQVEGKEHAIDVCYDGRRLYVRSWWPVMPLLSLGGSRFEFSSFPIKLAFRKDAAGRVDSVDVTGIYDWEIVGTRMKRSDA